MSEVTRQVATADHGPPYFAIVRRGQTAIFQFLRGHFEEPNLVEVIWDRRAGEHRNGDGPIVREACQVERRSPQPRAWETFGFILAPWNPSQASGNGAAPAASIAPDQPASALNGE